MGFSPGGVCSCLAAANYVSGRHMAIAPETESDLAHCEEPATKQSSPWLWIASLRSQMTISPPSEEPRVCAASPRQKHALVSYLEARRRKAGVWHDCG